MTRTSRIGFARALAADAAKASARAGRPADAHDSRVAATYLVLEGEVLEVLDGYGLAHVRAADGLTYGLTRRTPGVCFADLRKGQRVRVEVARKFNRVMYAQLLGDSSLRTVGRSEEEGGAPG
jgi:hypothetical protein